MHRVLPHFQHEQVHVPRAVAYEMNMNCCGASMRSQSDSFFSQSKNPSHSDWSPWTTLPFGINREVQPTTTQVAPLPSQWTNIPVDSHYPPASNARNTFDPAAQKAFAMMAQDHLANSPTNSNLSRAETESSFFANGTSWPTAKHEVVARFLQQFAPDQLPINASNFMDERSVQHLVKLLQSMEWGDHDLDRARSESPDSERDSKALRLETNHKTKLCKHFQLKQACAYGENCSFAHSEEELRCPTAAGNTVAKEQKAKKKPASMKTKFCKNFLYGQCKYGTKCNFAHGMEELRVPVKKNKDKGMGIGVPLM